VSTSSAASTAVNLRSTRRAADPRRRIFSLSPFFLALLFGAAPAFAADAGCGPDNGETVAIRHIHDGDTVFLDSDEKVRLIGIDTPELGRDERPPDPGAVAARNRLRELVAKSDAITLRRGIDERGKYGRLLAHLYADGRNLQAQLLAEGLAVALTIPPNLTHLDCYQQATAKARAGRRGVWALPPYQPRAADSLHEKERGYRIVHGTVRRVGHSRCCVWLNLDDDFALRIEREHRSLFEGIDFNRLEGERLEARGYLYFRNDQLRMQIRHPADLAIGE